MKAVNYNKPTYSDPFDSVIIDKKAPLGAFL